MTKRKHTKEVGSIGSTTVTKRLHSVNHTRLSTPLTAQQRKSSQHNQNSRAVQRHLEDRQRYSGESQAYTGNIMNPNTTEESEDPDSDCRNSEDDDNNNDNHVDDEDDEEN